MVEINIKNMVCPRCIMAVENLLKELGVNYSEVNLGKVILPEKIPDATSGQFEKKLVELGFELAMTKEMKWVEEIKRALIELINSESLGQESPVSAHIEHKTGEEYTKMSHLFNGVTGITIERYFIYLKIEKAKEWLSYSEYNISETAWNLGYSSIQHFSAQFKKTTGLTPSQYKKLNDKPRKSLDKVIG